MESTLQKLKVTELKELLAKHHLVQTGKKDDLVKRLIENNIAPEDGAEGGDAESGDLGEEELVDPDEVAEPSNPAPAVAPVPAPSTSAAAAAAPVSTDATSTPATAPATTNGTPAELTPEQQAMKARAERFGIPFNPNATPSSRTSKPATEKKTTPTTSTPPTTAPAKAGAIDKAPLGISDEVLAKRAAKFGLPEKKAAPAPAAAAPAAAPAPAKPEVEMTPELKEKIAIEEEKKRKRAEKFGIALPSETNGTNSEPEAKKTKV